MDLDNRVAANLNFVRGLVEKAGMVDDPTYYSGSGATPDYLSGAQLAQIHSGIKGQYGESAAAAYETMVRALPMLSPSDFLTTLKRLAARSWVWSPGLVSDEKSMDFGSWGASQAAFADALTGRKPQDYTANIRKDFFERIGRS